MSAPEDLSAGERPADDLPAPEPLSEAALRAALEREGLRLRPEEVPAVLVTARYLHAAARRIREALG